MSKLKVQSHAICRSCWRSSPADSSIICSAIRYHSTPLLRFHPPCCLGTDHTVDGLRRRRWPGLPRLAKVFNSVNCRILCEKMLAHGIRRSFVDWTRSFLSNRIFRVRVARSYSAPLSLCSGIPRSSVLGYFLFLIFSNDLSDIWRNSKADIQREIVSLSTNRDPFTSSWTLIAKQIA